MATKEEMSMKSTSSRRHRTTRKIPDKNQIFGPEKTRAQVMAEIMAAPDLYRQFQKLSARLQDELVEFAMGVRGLNVTYDPVFKTIFSPETRRERLEIEKRKAEKMPCLWARR